MKQPITKVKVLEPRLLSGQKKGNIIELYNIEDYEETFYLFGGKYQKVQK